MFLLIFVSATKIGKFLHINLQFANQTTLTAHNLTSHVLLLTRNAERTHTDQSTLIAFLLYLKGKYKSSKEEVAENFLQEVSILHYLHKNNTNTKVQNKAGLNYAS